MLLLASLDRGEGAQELADVFLSYARGDRAAAERLASFFLSLIERQELVVGEKQAEFVLPMSRLDIADYLGLTKETVSRMVAELRNRKLIRLASQDRVEILDRSGLQEMAEGFGE